MIAGLCTRASADISESDLGGMVGYTIIGTYTVTGWFDKKKDGKKGDSFEGCDYHRVIILDDDKAVVCNGYGYSYSYRPRAVILSDGSSYKMVVSGHAYDVVAP